jgi:hypothetical protein
VHAPPKKNINKNILYKLFIPLSAYISSIDPVGCRFDLNCNKFNNYFEQLINKELTFININKNFLL